VQASLDLAAGGPPIGGEDAEGAASLGHGAVRRQEVAAIEAPGFAFQVLQALGEVTIAILDPGIKDGVEQEFGRLGFPGKVHKDFGGDPPAKDQSRAPGAEVSGKGGKGFVQPPAGCCAHGSDTGRFIQDIDRQDRPLGLQGRRNGGIVRKPQVAAKPQDDRTHARSMWEGGGLI